MSHDPTFWLLARAFGLTAYVMLTLSVLAGIVLRSRPFPSLKPSAVTDLHRTLALLGLTALVGHGGALVLDSWVHVTLPALVVPGLISYRPVATSIGVATAELMLLIYVSFGLRKRIGTRLWRRLHWASYAVFAGATAHGLAAGTDSGEPWAFGLYVGAVAAVIGAVAWRALAPPAPLRRRGTPRGREAEVGG